MRYFVLFVVAFMTACSGGGGGDGGAPNTTFPTQQTILADWTQTSVVDDGTGNTIEAVSRHVIAEFTADADRSDYDALGALLTGRGSSVIGQIPAVGIVQILALSDADIPVLIQLLAQQSYISRAYPNIAVQTTGTTSASPSPFRGSSAWVAATGVEVAWDITTGDASVIAAVVEGRVDFSHPQFQKNSTRTVGLPTAATSTHALAVASILGAHGNDTAQNGSNGSANVAGVAWDCTLMTSPTRLSTAGVIAAIQAAITAGARVVNVSLVPTTQTAATMPFWRSSLLTAVRLASTSNALIVLSAANTAITDDLVTVPGVHTLVDVARYETNVLIVSTPGASSGNAIDVIAPTSGIGLVQPTSIATAPAAFTSYAAPQAAGAAALCMSADPSVSAANVKRAIARTAIQKNLDIGGAVCAMLPLRSCLLPLDSLAAGTRNVYDMKQTITFFGTEVLEYERIFEIGRVVDPNGPPINIIDLVVGEAGTHDEAKSDTTSLGVRYSSKGLEVMYVNRVLLKNTSFSLGPFSVTVVSPGVLVAPESLRMGGSWSANVTSLITLFNGTWEGPNARPGYPRAHEFTLEAEAIFDGDIDTTETFVDLDPPTKVLVSGTVYLAPWVGPVEGTLTKETRTDTELIERVVYEFKLK